MRRLVLVGLVACSSPSSSTDNGPIPPTPVATFNVTIEGRGDFDPADLRLAIMWDRGDLTLWPARLLEVQELFIASHTLTWPAHYEVSALAAPPFDPFFNSPTVGYRGGSLVAYRDGNGNGKLDFTPVDAPAFTDRIVAFHPFLRVMYFTTVDTWSVRIGTTGLSGDDSDVSTPVTLLRRDEPEWSCHLLERGAPESAYLYIGHVDPNAGQGPWDHEAWQNAPCPGNELPEHAASVDCFGDTSFQAFTAVEPPSQFIAQTCGMLMSQCMSRGDARPASWPCPCAEQTAYLCEDF